MGGILIDVLVQEIIPLSVHVFLLPVSCIQSKSEYTCMMPGLVAKLTPYKNIPEVAESMIKLFSSLYCFARSYYLKY